MITDAQEETLKKLEAGKLSPKQKADFYYRMSNILKNYLEGLNEAAYLLDAIPDSYLEKINLQGAAAKSMLLCEAMMKQLDLPTVEANFIKTDIEAVRKFDLGEDNRRLLPQDYKEYPFPVIGCSVVRGLTGAEAETVTRILEHIQSVEAMLVPRRQKMSEHEFLTRVQPSIYTDAENKAVECHSRVDSSEEPCALMRLLETFANVKKRQETKDLMIERPPQ